MSEPNPTPETTPAAPAPASETPATPPAAPEQGQPPAAAPGAKPQGPARGGKRPFRGDKPKQDRPKLDLSELTVNLKMNELDKDIEADLAAAMAGFETEIKEDTE